MAVVKGPVALGGTGADNAADARANLGISSNTSGGAYSGIFVSNKAASLIDIDFSCAVFAISAT